MTEILRETTCDCMYCKGNHTEEELKIIGRWPPVRHKGKEAQPKMLDMLTMLSNVSKASKSSKAIISARGPPPPLFIRGLSQENQAQFKFLAKNFNLKHSEFLELLLVSFAESNPEVLDSLTNRRIKLNVEYKEPVREMVAHSIEAENHLNRIRQLISEGQLSQKALGFRCDTLLRPFLLNKNVPQAQKDEIYSFIQSVASGSIRGTE